MSFYLFFLLTIVFIYFSSRKRLFILVFAFSLVFVHHNNLGSDAPSQVTRCSLKLSHYDARLQYRPVQTYCRKTEVAVQFQQQVHSIRLNSPLDGNASSSRRWWRSDPRRKRRWRSKGSCTSSRDSTTAALQRWCCKWSVPAKVAANPRDASAQVQLQARDLPPSLSPSCKQARLAQWWRRPSNWASPSSTVETAKSSGCVLHQGLSCESIQ